MADGTAVISPSAFLSSSSPQMPHNHELTHHDQRPAKAPRKTPAALPRTKATGVTVVEPDKVDSNPVPKQKLSKSRNGCSTCKAKRLKCDEAKPTCLQCTKRKVTCGGYHKDFKWKPFEDSHVKPVPAVKRGRKPSIRSAAQESTAGVSATATAAPTQTTTPSSTSSQSDLLVSVSTRPRPASRTCSGEFTFSAQPDGDRSTNETASTQSPTLDNVNLLPLQPMAFISGPDFTTPLSLLVSAAESQPPPTIITDLPLLHPSFLDSSSISDLVEGLWSPGPFPSFSPTDNAVGDEGEDDTQEWQTLSRYLHQSQSMDLSMAKLPTAPGFDPNSYRGFFIPETTFNQESIRVITRRFETLTCGILSVKDGATENPWRTLIWPMTSTSPALFHAICAMSAFHASREDPRFLVAGHEHVSQALANLHEGIRDKSMRLDTAVATSLSLGFAQSWGEHTTNGNAFIKGARILLSEALEKSRRQPLTGPLLARLKFLCNAWVYMDVIARLTSNDCDETEDYDEIFSAFSNPSSDHHGFGIDFGMPMDAELDPLMGCANTLFPLIGKTANLACRVQRSETMSPSIISQAMELKLLLETWDPPELIEPPEDRTATVGHSLQTAEAYRWATLLYLHQAVPDIPSPTSSKLAAKVLVLLATVPLASRFMIVHIFPLMLAGCEAFTTEDRAWVLERWAGIGRRLQIKSVDRCVEITREVWRRRDVQEARPCVRRTLVSTSSIHSLDRHQARLARFDSMDFSTLDTSGRPGATGVDGADCRHRLRPSMALGESADGRDQYHAGGRLHWLGVMREWGWELLLG